MRLYYILYTNCVATIHNLRGRKKLKTNSFKIYALLFIFFRYFKMYSKRKLSFTFIPQKITKRRRNNPEKDNRNVGCLG